MNIPPLITLITVAYNAVKDIENTILSVLNQTYPNIEYIIIDGGSTDGTLDIIKKYEDKISYWVSEPDKGIYDAMNKGALKATGEWLNFMNAGDTFYNEQVLEKVFKDNDWSDADVIYGDVVYVYPNKEDFRKALSINRMKKNIPFCHQSVFVRTELQQKHLFNTTYKICADYKVFFDLYNEHYKFKYKNIIVSKFLFGGCSTKSAVNVYLEEWHISGEKNNFHFICRIIWSFCKESIRNLFK